MDEPVVLAVDDEPQALKYLAAVIGRPCLTAASAAEAQAVVERDPGTIAVALCDQRMPGGDGVGFLAWLRQRRPDCVRVLVTAYADIDAAIAAVNRGGIFQFVLKPWQPAGLRSLVDAAIEHHLLQRDRDRLAAERLDLLQRRVAADRVRHLAVTAAALAGRLRHPLLALRAFLSHCPSIPAADREDGHVQWSDLWDLAQQDCQRALAALDGMVDLSALPAASFAPGIDLAALVAAAGGAVPELALRCDPPGPWPAIAGDAGLLGRMFAIFLRRLADPRLGLTGVAADCAPVSMHGGAPGVRVRLRGSGKPWTRGQLLALLGGPEGADGDAPGLLAAYAIAFHHGGGIAISGAAPEGPGVVVDLPLDPGGQAPPVAADPAWMGRLIAVPEA